MSNWKDNMKMVDGLSSLIGSAYNMANPNTDSLEQSIDAQIEAMKQNQGVQANSLDDLMNQWSSFRLMDTDFNADDYYKGPSNGDIFKNTLSSTISGATTGAAAGGWGALAGAAVGLGSSLIGGLIGRSKAQSAANKAASDLKAEAERQNAYKQASFDTMAQNLTTRNNRMLASQIAAYGGVLPGYGGDWSNGLKFINTGDRHEQNPIGGVPMGMAEDGTPNLVEEGEVIWNDYVFSNRLKVPDKTMETYGIKGKKDMTFAEAVEKLQKASSERPNDPIEKRTLDSILSNLVQEQEIVRQEKNEEEQFNQMEDMAAYAADGGPIHIAKNKRGTFTAAATKHGMGVQEFASHVLSNKDKYSTAMVKKANFARNASKWNHAYGGPLGRIFEDEGNYPNYLWGTNPQTDFNQGYDLLFNDYRDRPRLTDEDLRILRPKRIPNSPEPLLPLQTLEGMKTDFGIPVPTEVIGSKQNSENPSNWETWLRYAPVLGASVGLGYTLFNRPDHRYANELEAAAKEITGNTPRVSYTPIGDYLAYNPFDRVFYANELGAQQAATRRGILNLSNGNRGTAMAGLLTSGYNGNIGLGKLYREGEEYNLAQRQKVADFNRGTNMFNSEADLKTQMANAEMERANANLLLDARMKALGLKQAEDQAWDTSLAANLTNLFDNIGNIGWEAANRNMINSNLGLYYGIGRDNKLYYKNAYNKLSPEEKAKVDEQSAALGIEVGKKNGGYLTIKNRRRR